MPIDFSKECDYVIHLLFNHRWIIIINLISLCTGVRYGLDNCDLFILPFASLLPVWTRWTGNLFTLFTYLMIFWKKRGSFINTSIKLESTSSYWDYFFFQVQFKAVSHATYPALTKSDAHPISRCFEGLI